MRTSLILLLAAAASAPGYAQTVTFAAVADTGDTEAATAVANLIKKRGTDFVLAPGDLCYGNVPLSEQVGPRYGSFVGARRFWPAPGNHEYSDPCGASLQGYLSYFTLPNNERYYSQLMGPVEVFVLNSNAQEPDGLAAGSTQGQWLKQKLASSTASWKLVLLHHPPFSSGSHQSTLQMRWPFEAWGADAVISAHDHVYERVLRDDNSDGRSMPYFITGLGGFSKHRFTTIVQGSAARYNAEFGAMFITAKPNALSFEFRNISGTVIDRYNLSKLMK
jgi:tartrate-resistant acid phosphatase type 5